MGEPGNRIVHRTHSLFVDDLEQYQESHKTLKDVNEIIVQASHDMGASYGVSKCAEVVSEHGKVTKGKELQVLEENMKTMDPDENEICKFLGVEQADGIKTKIVFERTKRVRMLVNTELNDANLISAINAKVIPVTAYPINICKFNNGEPNQLGQVIKKELHAKNMLGRQASDKRLSQTRRRCKRTEVSDGHTQGDQAAHRMRREQLKEENAIIAECLTIMEEVGVRMRFEGGNIRLDNELVEAEWKPTWKKVKSTLKKRCMTQES